MAKMARVDDAGKLFAAASIKAMIDGPATANRGA
jgi:hypothetical protein